MSFPDRIERTTWVPHPPARVWTALTTPEGLGGWFGDAAEVDLRPGGAAEIRWRDGHVVRWRVERVEEPSVVAFTWDLEGLPAGDPRRTYVEFTLVGVEDGTRLTVVETGFAQLPDDRRDDEYGAHVEGWEREMGELVAYVDAA